MNQLDKIIAFENGELNDNEIVELFQYLVDSELAWQLQGYYGRAAKALIESGHIVKKYRREGE